MNNLVMKDTISLPVIAARGLVVFPNTLMHFDMVREKSIKALEHAMANGQMAFLTMQKDIRIEEPKERDLERVGTICRVKQVVKLPGGLVRVLIEGVKRAQLIGLEAERPFLRGVLTELICDEDEDELKYEALKRRVISEFQKYAENNQRVNPEIVMSLENMESPSDFADSVSANLQLKITDKQELLNCVCLEDRLHKLITILINETQILEIDKEINQKVKKNIDKNQKEYFLREQIKVIEEELGDKDGVELEIKELTAKMKEIGVPKELYERCKKELSRMKKMQYGNPEANVIRNYVTWVCDLPWNISTDDDIDVKKSRKILDRDHYGLDKVKERILEYLAVKKITNSLKGPILCLVGPPGVGKTSIAKSVAESLGRNYVRISLGGVRDEAEIRGHRKTYIGAMPGRIINALKTAGSNNPLMLFDEIDKMSSDFRGDPASAMLEVLDSEQNKNFRDHYIEAEFDLSNVLFIATANTLETVPRPLLDRMEIVQISGYTQEEKFKIAKKHLLPKKLSEHGLKKANLSISDGALYDVISYYTREAGVRGLERKIAEVCRKAALKISEDGIEKVSVNSKNLEDLLGKKKFCQEKVSKKDEIGVVTGLAWTEAGGDTLAVEVNIMAGSGKTELTGQLGDVMQESAKTAVSFVRANADKLGVINKEFYKDSDIHIHVPEGATPKDGPSAGITMATALISALSERKVKSDVAMTGEITLRGRVLPIGGLKEKTLAAYTAGVKTVVIPKANEKDLDEVLGVVKENVKIITAETMDDVIAVALVK